ncbi:MAG TPA: hypothetical protein VJZ00_16895 [Thermoanaerobaculia bacterium]|nr:hypothetical protein [Thermoanaerobaculia bacterium]
MGLLIAGVVIFIGIVALAAVWQRWNRQVGGRSYGPFERADGSMTVSPTGYPEEMKGHAKVISPTDNAAADTDITNR